MFLILMLLYILILLGGDVTAYGSDRVGDEGRGRVGDKGRGRVGDGGSRATRTPHEPQIRYRYRARAYLRVCARRS